MTNFNADIVAERQALLKKYSQISSWEQTIVQLCSLIYEPVKRTTFMTCLNPMTAGIENYQPASINTILNKLIKANLLIEKSGHIQCHPLLVEIATRETIEAGCLNFMISVVEKEIPISTYGSNGRRVFSSKSRLLREVRFGIYRQDIAFINKQIEDYNQYNSSSKDKVSLDEVLRVVCNNPFDQDWFSTLSPELFEIAIIAILSNATLTLSPADEAFDLLCDRCSEAGANCSDSLRLMLTEQLILRGNLQSAQHHLDRISDDYRQEAQFLQAWLVFLRGDHAKTLEIYASALKTTKKTKAKQKVNFPSLSGLIFVLALLKDGSGDRLREAENYTNSIIRQSNHWFRNSCALLQCAIKQQLGDIAQKDSILNTLINHGTGSQHVGALFSYLSVYWVNPEVAKKHLPNNVESFYLQAELGGYHWLSMSAAELLAKLKPRSNYRQQAVELREDNSISLVLADLIKSKEAWELCLNALVNLDKEPQTVTKIESESRLAWFITFYSQRCVIQPREQKVTAKGVWSKGRPIALKRLKSNLDEFDYLTAQDLKVCSCIEATYESGYYGKTDYNLNDRAIAALIGHPYVFWEDVPNNHVEIVKGEPELIVKKEAEDHLILEFSPKIQDITSVITIKETPSRIKVIEINPEYRRIGEIIGKENRLVVPMIAKERVLAAISAVSGIVTIHSDIGGEMETAQEVVAESKPHFHLLIANGGLKVSALVRPFGQGGSYFRPGTGGETIIAEIDGKRLQTRRDLNLEKTLVKGAIAACPTLVRQEEQEGEWLIPETEDCLSFLLELQALEDNVVVEWPEGEKLKVSHHAGLNDFKLAIQRQNDWFAASGELKLDDSLVFDMKRLMELLEQTPSRFIPLGQGEFLALTQEFRQRLDELRAFSEKHGKGVRFHSLATLALGDMVDQVGNLEADKHWKAHTKKLKEMQNLQPELPSTLKTELRDYQLEGFQWLSRLAYWGVGACLADDMGLGKTIQALALILSRASGGPTLIVAPTSVCINWVSEAQKFAPTLNVIQFGSGDRQKILDKLQPLDMLICSYGLLQQEDVAQMLAQVEWQTIVLDEAQSIKNFNTKRSQAAMSLQAGFKLITTGTPIENHLGELWNLFRFINPGLLGSLENFNQRFAFPIERFQEKSARHKLKKLIQPFLLRRTKNQVLQELPSRTEITLHVDLSPEEIALYETLRRDAIAKLNDSEANAGAKHLQVLVEIMKLRRACCNPSLVMPDIPLKSSKLQVFGEVLSELLENRHKALVFSQFVDHLHIIRDYLDQQKISYQYLDGSTPTAERKKRVDAFQSGVGDVFLISLKAGGTGLNLTAADYVIHMDPWWNPAVEDQASDRAHRIGQQRPVTIYRLVAKNTIEEKIVDLHHQKRDLADSLLEGTDVSGKISTEALLQLIYNQ